MKNSMTKREIMSKMDELSSHVQQCKQPYSELAPHVQESLDEAVRHIKTAHLYLSAFGTNVLPEGPAQLFQEAMDEAITAMAVHNLMADPGHMDELPW